MARPALLYKWSDSEEVRAVPRTLQPPLVADPRDLQDMELQLWVSYPDKGRKGSARKKSRCRKRPPKRSLRAVMIFEEIDRVAAYTYRVELRRVFKSGDRLIAVEVTNDPEDQSEEANIFSFVRPAVKNLQPLEQHLAMVAAKRLYDVIEGTWPQSRARAGAARIMTG